MPQFFILYDETIRVMVSSRGTEYEFIYYRVGESNLFELKQKHVPQVLKCSARIMIRLGLNRSHNVTKKMPILIQLCKKDSHYFFYYIDFNDITTPMRRSGLFKHKKESQISC